MPLLASHQSKRLMLFTASDDLLSDLFVITAAIAATHPLLLAGLAFIVPLCQRTPFACSPLLARLATHQNRFLKNQPFASDGDFSKSHRGSSASL